MTRFAGHSATSQRLGLLGVLVLLLGLVLPLAPAAEATHALGTVQDVQADRYGGENRFDTAGLIANDVSGGDAPDVLLARADLYPDTLSGNFLAGVRDVPVLLMPQDFLFEDTMGWLETLGTENITILGGTAAISAGNEEALEDEGYNVDRIGGETRFETAKLISEQAADEGAVGTWDGERTAIVASGENFPDALVAGALGFSENFPVLLTNTDFLTDYTQQALDNLDIERAIIPGGSAAVSEDTENEIQDMGITTTRVNGRTRVTTATEFADFVQDEFGWGYDLINIARGDLFPDALTVGPLAGSAEAPLLLTYDPNTLGGATLDNGEMETEPWLRAHACEIRGLHFAGGDQAITADTADEAEAAAEDCAEQPAAVAALNAENVGEDTNVVGEDHTVSASATDSDGDPAMDVNIRFEVASDGEPSPSSGNDDTNVNGVAFFTFNNDVAGDDTITACTNEDGSLPATCDEADLVQDSVTKRWVDRLASSLDATPNTDSNIVGDPHTVSAEVRDQNDELLEGVTVRFDVQSGPNDDVSDSDTTDTNGHADFTYTGDNGEGTDQILVWADSDDDGNLDDGEHSETVSKTWTTGPPATLDLSPQTDVNPVESTHTVNAIVRDSNGNPISGADVRFEVTGANPATGSEDTDVSGTATFAYFGTNAGFDNITACTNDDGTEPTTCATATGPSDTASKEWQERVASSLDLAPEADTNEVGSQHTVTATVTDQFGAPVEGEAVQFEVTGTHITSDTDTTDANGQATFTYPEPADDQTGTDTITACMAPGPCADEAPGEDDNSDVQDAVTKTWESTPEQLSLDSDVATNTVGEQHTVTATVTDGAGQPVEDAVVLFQVEATDETATTNASGQATFSYSTTEAGDDTITACTTEDGDTPADCPTTDELTDTQTKHWEPQTSSARLDLSPEETTNTVETTHTVTASVTDQYGNAIEGWDVRFDVEDETTTTVDTTDENGQATFSYSAAAAGDDTIAACTNSDGTAPASGDCPTEDPAVDGDADLVDRVIKHWTPEPS